jgi:hypothetical protein
MESELNIWQKRLQLLQQIRERENTSSPDEIIPENTQKINLPVRDYIQHNRFQAEDIEDIKSRLEEIRRIVFNSGQDIIKLTGNITDILKINITSKSVSFNYKGTEYKSPNQLSDSSFAQELLSLETSPEKYGEKLFEAIFNSKSLEVGGKYTPTLVGFSELNNSEIK